MGGGQRQSSPQRGKAKSEHENPFAQALYVSLTHSIKNKKRRMEEEGLRRVGRCSPPLTDAAAHSGAAPEHARPRGPGWPGCGDMALEGRARARDSSTALGRAWTSSAAGPSQQDRKKSRQQ